MKKILILNASASDNSITKTLSETFITRSIQRGFQVKKYDLNNCDIKPFSSKDIFFTDEEKPSSIDDDFNKIALDLVKCDVVVFSAPVYFYSMPGTLKNFIDRLFCFVAGNKNISEKEFVIISAGKEDDMSTFDGLRIPIEKTGKFFGWSLLDEVLALGIDNISDLDNTNALTRVKEIVDKIN